MNEREGKPKKANIVSFLDQVAKWQVDVRESPLDAARWIALVDAQWAFVKATTGLDGIALTAAVHEKQLIMLHKAISFNKAHTRLICRQLSLLNDHQAWISFAIAHPGNVPAWIGALESASDVNAVMPVAIEALNRTRDAAKTMAKIRNAEAGLASIFVKGLGLQPLLCPDIAFEATLSLVERFGFPLFPRRSSNDAMERDRERERVDWAHVLAAASARNSDHGRTMWTRMARGPPIRSREDVCALLSEQLALAEAEQPAADGLWAKMRAANGAPTDPAVVAFAQTLSGNEGALRRAALAARALLVVSSPKERKALLSKRRDDLELWCTFAGLSPDKAASVLALARQNATPHQRGIVWAASIEHAVFELGDSSLAIPTFDIAAARARATAAQTSVRALVAWADKKGPRTPLALRVLDCALAERHNARDQLLGVLMCQLAHAFLGASPPARPSVDDFPETSWHREALVCAHVRWSAWAGHDNDALSRAREAYPLNDNLLALSLRQLHSCAPDESITDALKSLLLRTRSNVCPAQLLSP